MTLLSRRRALGLALSATVAAACGSSSKTSTPVAAANSTLTSTGATAAGAGQESAPPDAAVPPLLDFSAPVVGGGTFAGASVAGQPVAFWFWAPY